MKILIANLGSTSFKYRLFDMSDSNAAQLASGGFERVTDYTSCIEEMLESLVGEGHLQSGEEIDAVGFKTVLGKDLSGCVTADARVLEALFLGVLFEEARLHSAVLRSRVPKKVLGIAGRK